MSRRRTSKSAPTGATIVVLLIALAIWAVLEYLPETDTTATTPENTFVVPTVPTRVPQGANETPPPNENGERPYRVYFTTSRYPDRPEYHSGGVDETLVELIDSAQQSIDMAIYDFDLENVAQALAAAEQRGVQVRIVTDSDTLANDDPLIQDAFAILQTAKIPIVEDDRGPIMHHKFVVVDEQTVLTGSWNFTENDTYRLNNNVIIISSPQLAQNYTDEFEKMFTERTFGPNKRAGVPFRQIELDGITIETHFASEEDVAEAVIRRIDEAEQSIDFMAFSFTSNEIGQAVLTQHEQGVDVRGVFETTGSQTEFSEYSQFKEAGLEVYTDGNPYVMHHKVFIIDNRTVILGSYNFSDNANTANDENLLIIDDPLLAQQFTAEFERVQQVALNPLKK